MTARPGPQGGAGRIDGQMLRPAEVRGVKLFHYERTRVVFIHSPLFLRWAGLRREWRRLLNPSKQRFNYRLATVPLQEGSKILQRWRESPSQNKIVADYGRLV